MTKESNVIPFKEEGVLVHPKEMKYDKYYHGTINGVNLRIVNVSQKKNNPIIRIEVQ